MKQTFTVHLPPDPHRPICGLISIPHSGETFPEEFLPYLTQDTKALWRDTDYKVESLLDIEKLTAHGFIIMHASVHRSCLDLNRKRQDACLNWKHNTHGEVLVTAMPPENIYEELTRTYWDPYFQFLTETVKRYEHQKDFFVIDFHSMPSAPTDHHLKQNPKQSLDRPDLCLSDFHGQSCPLKFIEKITQKFKDEGFNAQINTPYFGGYITQHLIPMACPNIQIEVNRKLYMNEREQTLIIDNDKSGDRARMELLKQSITGIFCS